MQATAEFRDCLTHDVLAAYVDGRLSPGEVIAANRHIDECATCRAELSAVAAVDTGLAQVELVDESTEIDQGPWWDEEATLTNHIEFLTPGSMCGEYRIEGTIGTGGMGEVFAAVHPVIGKRAAIKVLREALCKDPMQVQRFADEARIVNEIGHPNIVDVFAFGTTHGRHFFVMEWLRGETLRARVNRAPLDVLDVCAILVPLVRALDAAHAKGVIHRDLKPDNVFLVAGKDGLPTVKLLDFGIAKLVGGDRRQTVTKTGALVGTPRYAAPEQIRGDAIDARTDIYALGGMAFELLTGQPVFVAGSEMEVLAMLAKDPAQRPTLAEIAAALEPLPRRLSRNIHIPRYPTRVAAAVVVPVVTAHIPNLRPHRDRRAFMIGALAAIAAAIAFVIAMWPGDELPSARQPPRPMSEPQVQSIDASPPENDAPVRSQPVEPAPRPIVVKPVKRRHQDGSGSARATDDDLLSPGTVKAKP